MEEARREVDQSGDAERIEGRIAESSDVDRTVEKSTPSSATTSSEENPPHSKRLLRSMGVPRPAYLMSGHDPREVFFPGTVCECSCCDDDFFDDFFMLGTDTGAAVCDMNEIERERMGDRGGEAGGDGVAGGNSEVDAIGDPERDRQVKSRLKSVKTSNMEVSTSVCEGSSTVSPCTVLSSSSSSLSGIVAAFSCAATNALVKVSERLSSAIW
jgi:hypothetical protein